MDAKYFAADGARITDKDAQIIGDELARIEARTGHGVTADVFTREAADPSSPLHPYVWDCDDATAAYRYRVERARGLMRCIEIEIIEGDKESRVRGWHAMAQPIVITQGEPFARPMREYTAFSVVYPDRWQIVVAQAERDLHMFEERYRRYSNVAQFAERFAPVMQQIVALAEPTPQPAKRRGRPPHERPAVNGNSWSEDDDATLIRLMNSGNSLSQAAVATNHTMGDARERWRMLARQPVRA